MAEELLLPVPWFWRESNSKIQANISAFLRLGAAECGFCVALRFRKCSFRPLIDSWFTSKMA
jgi:hypothetical protein